MDHHDYMKNDSIVAIAKDTDCETQSFASRLLWHSVFLEIVCVRPKAWETWFFITVFEKSHEVVIRLNDYNNCPLWAKILSKLELHRFEVSHIHIVCKRFQYSRRLRVFIPNHLMRSNIIE